MLKLGLRTKFLTLTIGAIIVMALAITIFVRTNLKHSLTVETQKRGEIIAHNIAKESTNSLLAQNIWELKTLAIDHTEIDDSVDFVFITDPVGKVLAHTFGDSFPTAFKKMDLLKNHKYPSSRFFRSEMGDVLHVIAPVLAGGVGIVHVGVDAEPIKQTVNEIIAVIIKVIFFVTLIVCFIAVFFVEILINPVLKLTKIAELVGNGDFQQKADDIPGDEIGRLAISFNQMVDRLRGLTEGLEKKIEERTSQLETMNRDLGCQTDFFESMIKNIPDAVVIADTNRLITMTNPALEKIFGYHPLEIVGKPTMDLYESEDSFFDQVIQRFNDKAEEHTEPYIVNYKRKDGDIFPGETVGTVLKNSSGKVIALLHLIRDVSERKRAEDTLKQAHDNLEKRVEERTVELQETYSQLLHAEKLSAIGGLSASIAHEFNNPLQGVMNILAGVSHRATLDEDDAELMIMAGGECMRMRKLISNLQDFNRPSSGKKGTIDLHTTLDSLLVLGKKEYSTKNIIIEKSYAENLPIIEGVGDQIKQVLLNLLNNASHACEGGGIITIETEKAGEEVVVRVQDNGVGIDPEIIDSIFDPFFTTKETLKGTGLGLSVSYGIVKEHAGEINVVSKPGKGATFSVTFPIQGGQNA